MAKKAVAKNAKKEKPRPAAKPAAAAIPAAAAVPAAGGGGGGGDGLPARIRRFSLNFLKRGYTAVKPETPLSVFKDGRTLDILAGAFADEVQYGSLFEGLIDPAKLRLPQGEYFPVIEKKGATVADVIQYFLKKARQAAP